MELVRAAEWPGELAACCRVLTRSEINKRNQPARFAAWYQVGVDAMHEAFPMVIAVIGVIAVSSIILRFASALAKRLEGRSPTMRTVDRKSTRLNSSHVRISYAVFCLKKNTYTTLFRSDRKSTRLNSSHVRISYAVFCLKKKTYTQRSRLHAEQSHNSRIAYLVSAHSL